MPKEGQWYLVIDQSSEDNVHILSISDLVARYNVDNINNGADKLDRGDIVTIPARQF